VRLRAGGKRVWIAQYRLGAKQRRVTIGSVETIDPDDARKHAKAVLAKAQLGTDAQTEKAEARARAAITLGATVDKYLDRYAAPRLKPKSLKETRRYLRVTWKPLHEHRLDKIDRRSVAARLVEIAGENGPIAANRARAALTTFFGWALREGLADANPVVGTNKPAEERSRERVLSDAELAAIWSACRDDEYGTIVRLLILTGQRREEVGGMRRSELDIEQAIWAIPAERTKNGIPHLVPLPEAAIRLLCERLSAIGDRDLLFGTGARSFTGWSVARATLQKRIGESQSDVQPWRLHDLRRTVATRMGDLGVLPHVVEAVLNHVSGHKAGVAGVYNRALYRAEKREALERWASYVGAISAALPQNREVRTGSMSE
jgi:integrase